MLVAAALGIALQAQRELAPLPDLDLLPEERAHPPASAHAFSCGLVSPRVREEFDVEIAASVGHVR